MEDELGIKTRPEEISNKSRPVGMDNQGRGEQLEGVVPPTHPSLGSKREDNGDNGRVGQEQIHDLLFGEKLSWQAIIYDLINTEQLDPWDIDISLLSNKYLEKVRELEEANFFVSSKVLLAASLLVRIKSDIILSHDLPSLDDVLFGKKVDKKYSQERIELDEELPELVPRTPLPRLRRVTLQELMSALGKAIKTENRRIKKEIVFRQRLKDADIVMPRSDYNIREKIRDIYSRLKNVFSNREEKLAFSELLESTGEDKIAAFVSLLHLDNQQRIWLEQENHFDEIWILLKSMYVKKNKDKLERMIAEVEAHERAQIKEVVDEEKIAGESSGLIDTGFSHSDVESGMED
jgi:segregation and condensation protein A